MALLQFTVALLAIYCQVFSDDYVIMANGKDLHQSAKNSLTVSTICYFTNTIKRTCMTANRIMVQST